MWFTHQVIEIHGGSAESTWIEKPGNRHNTDGKCYCWSAYSEACGFWECGKICTQEGGHDSGRGTTCEESKQVRWSFRQKEEKIYR